MKKVLKSKGAAGTNGRADESLRLKPKRAVPQPAPKHEKNGRSTAKVKPKPREDVPRAVQNHGANGKGKEKRNVKPEVDLPNPSPEPAASRSSTALKPTVCVTEIAVELQKQQRKRVIIIKSRNMQMNRLQAIVAGTLGYHSKMEDKERLRKFKEASDLIKAVAEGKAECDLSEVIRISMIGINAFNHFKKGIEKLMKELAARLPVASWVLEPGQKGFGLLGLAIVIGETGDLSNYAGPAKVWKRMGCAPFESDGKVLMGATWKGGKEGKLSSLEWTEFGYSPRRRAVAHNVGEALLKQNFLKSAAGDNPNEIDSEDASGCSTNGAEGDGESRVTTDSTRAGPYRTRWLEAKRKALEKHIEWDWVKCDECKGEGPCGTCGGMGKKCLRGHRHGMLLMTKLLLKNLWVAWNKA